MIKLELDWAGDAEPDTGVWSGEGDEVTVVVAYDATPGVTGWPTVTAYAQRAHAGVASYRESMALDAWLAAEYEPDDDTRDELLALAVDC